MCTLIFSVITKEVKSLNKEKDFKLLHCNMELLTPRTQMGCLTIWVVSFTLGLAALWILKRKIRKDKLRHLPGPKGWPVFGSIFQLEREKMRLSLHKWARIYGCVYKVGLAIDNIVVVTGYKYIHHVLVSSGKEFGGRLHTFRAQYLDAHESVAGIPANHPSWSSIRKLSHKYMKQFGDGKSRLEAILSKNGEYMLRQFDSCIGQPVDIMNTLKSTVLRSVSVLLLGRTLNDGDPILDMLLKFERDLWDALDTSLGSLLLDIFPSLIHLPLPASQRLKKFRQLELDCCERIAAMKSEAKVESLTQVLLESASGGKSDADVKSAPQITERQAVMSSLDLIFAGTATSSRALYCLFNVMAFRQDIQDAVYAEIRKVLAGKKKEITFADRTQMPYLRATILECLRAFPPATYGAVPHVAINDTTIPDYGVIPEGTILMINTWALHHDESFWKDPTAFRPERFLDQAGQLLPPDHPNRKHVLPFGAGPRVCLGEVFARTRIFLWTAAVVNRFKFKPGPGSDEQWMDPNVHLDNIVLMPLPNKIVFDRRN